MPTLLATDTKAVLSQNAQHCDSRPLLLDRFVYDHPVMNEARKLHFAQVCLESFPSIRSTREAWQKTTADPKAKPPERQQAQRYLADTVGLGERANVVGPVTAKDAQGRTTYPNAEAQHLFVASLSAHGFLPAARQPTPHAPRGCSEAGGARTCLSASGTSGTAGADKNVRAPLVAVPPLYAQLQSRLLVNMAGGVMENAGLCLDRFGLPYVPGSAVKGCARRAALAALHEWCESGLKPGGTEADQDNLFKAACADFPIPAAMLAAIARVFGWGEQDWKTRYDFHSDDDWLKKRSDFAWACGNHWETTRAETLELLGSARVPRAVSGVAPEAPSVNPSSVVAMPPGATPGGAGRRPALPKDFAGSVSFLPAYPVDLPADSKLGDLPVPTLGKLELDIVTVHHKKYYAEPSEPKDVPPSDRRWQQWKREHDEWERDWGTAPDIEEPVPNVFPAVAVGHVFAFALRTLRSAEASLVNHVNHTRTWLACGLQTFGLGAKTNAGYGWFQDVTGAILAVDEAAKQLRAEQERQAKERAGVEAARATLQPDLALIEKLRAMKEADLRGQINPFATEERFWSQKDERVQLTLLHFLTATAPELFAADRANPKSKLAKALASLSAKFPHLASPKP